MSRQTVVLTVLVYAAMSVVTAIMYAVDKSFAMRDRRRVRERTLHLLALCGGWPGAVIAQQIFRHKRRKLGFVLITCVIAAAHVVVWVAIARSMFPK